MSDPLDDVNPTSAWSAAEYAQNGRFVATHGETVLGMLAAADGERILDVGCGDGALTRRIAESGAEVVGVDASPELVAAAIAAGTTAILGDAQSMTFDSEFDAVFSNAALHWMLQPDAVAARMFAALRPGGRLVVEFGGFGNVAAVRTALSCAMSEFGFPDADPGQYYPTATGYAAVLAAVGFRAVDTAIVPRQTALPGTMTDWLRTFRGGFLAHHGVPHDRQSAIIERTSRLLEPVLYDRDQGQWYADYVRLRATARRP